LWVELSVRASSLAVVGSLAMSLTPSRRRLLQATVLPPLAWLTSACTPTRRRPGAVDPDVALRQAAIAREESLVAGYTAANLSSPAVAMQVAGVVADHRQHLLALGVAGPPTGSAAPAMPGPTAAPGPAPTLAQLSAAERAAAAQHGADALLASPRLAAVLASLAASEASHPVALT
jgi:hypothetical protein